MQDFIYESPNNRVQTLDMVSIEISISLLLHFVPEHEYIQQLVTNVS